MTSEQFRTIIALVVTCVWGILALSTIVTKNYTALGATTPVMMIVVGFLFGYKAEGKRQNNDDPPSSNLPGW